MSWKSVMLDLVNSTSFYNFLNGGITIKEIEDFIFSSTNIEEQIGEDLYFELVNLNSNEKDFKYQLKSIIEPKILFGEIHKGLIISELNNILLNEKFNTQIANLYKFAELGYFFLAENELIGNYNEQGKSIYSHSTDIDKSLITSIYPDFFQWVSQIINDLNSNKIVFNNNKQIGNYGLEYFTYVDNRD